MNSKEELDPYKSKIDVSQPDAKDNNNPNFDNIDWTTHI